MNDRREALAAAIQKINKTFGDGTIMALGTTEVPPIEVVSTGAKTLDIALGVNGIPRGRLVEFYGAESSGKTTLALHVIANVQRQGGVAAIIDVEHALDLSYAAKLGVDVANLLHSQPDTGESALEIMETLVRAGIDAVVLDSVAMLVPRAEIEGEMQDKQFAEQARLITKGVRKLTGPVADANCICIFINQMRTQIGGYGASETTPGGRGLRHSYSVRVGLRKLETLRHGQEDTGIKVRATVAKNKVAPASRTAEFDIIFGRGIDYVATVIDAALRQGILSQSGAWIKYNGDTFSQGRDKAVEKLKNDPELLAQFEKEIAC